MSFMVNPHPYDDVKRVNYLNPKIAEKGFTNGLREISDEIVNLYNDKSFIFDYYLDPISLTVIEFDSFKDHVIKDVSDFYISEEQFIQKIKGSLPTDLKKDPYLLFGKIYEGEIDDFIDKDKVDNFFKENKDNKILLHGIGSSSKIFRKKIDSIVYFDRTPKDLSLLVSAEKYKHIIHTVGSSFNEKLRQFYYIDMMVAMRLRKELIKDSLIENYIVKNPRTEYNMVKIDSLKRIFEELVKMPIRPKPIYLPGVWGGEYIKTIRNLHKEIEQKISWVFEFIPLESSLGIILGDTYLDIPFYTFLNHKEKEVLGKEALEEFDGFFPVRVNYDDTWHGDGNMSIQVHPGEEFIKENYNEYGSQDEAYYIVATGHQAVTYAGMKIDPQQFISYCEDSYINKTTIDYKNFINYFDSKPGLQFMIPGGTLHSSGRNQFVLEHGSLTVGSYTYKLYDYVRKDLNGKPRPIHISNGAQVLKDVQDRQWAKENMMMKPLTLTSTSDYKEKIIGNNESMYYETRRIELNIKSTYIGQTNDSFALLAVVDGEKINVSNSNDEAYNYDAKYLDILIIPASMKEYKIKALGYQPVIVHKTILK